MTTLEEQIHADCATLKHIFDGLNRLETSFEIAREMMSPRMRGYFTPDEDDHVRQMLLAYRNYRRTLYEIIERHRNFRRVPEIRNRMRCFITGFAAALKLYRKSLHLIEVCEYDSFLRAKLNEPDSRFELDADFFEEVLIAFTSIGNYWSISRAGYFWRIHRRTAQRLGLSEDPDCGWLMEEIGTERAILHRKFWQVLLQRLRRDWRAAWRSVATPLRIARYRSQALFGATLANLRAPTHAHALRPDILRDLREILQPGDILLVRAEDKITSALLPGFWSHAALYVGDFPDLEKLGLSEHPPAARYRWLFDRGPRDHGYVVEAVTRGVRIHPLSKCLLADHVAILRPNLTEDDLKQAIAEAFSHVGKPYDFEFDFNVSSRIVCTELVYRCLHRRGTIAFNLVKRLGRWTLSADDIVRHYLTSLEQTPLLQDAPFKLAGVWLRHDDGIAKPQCSSAGIDALRKRLPST